MRMKITQHSRETCPGRPCSYYCDHTERTYDPEHVTRIDRHNYPAIHTACITILADNGALNRVEMEGGDAAKVVVLLPVHPASGFAHMESALIELASDDERWNTFLVGEDVEAKEIAVQDADLSHLAVILNLWFDIGMPWVRWA